MASGYRLQTRDVTFASGTTSTEAELNGLLLVGLRFPASMSGATMTFTNAIVAGGTSIGVLRSDGTSVSATITSSKQVVLTPQDFAGCNFITLVSSSSETNKTVTLVLADVS